MKKRAISLSSSKNLMFEDKNIEYIEESAVDGENDNENCDDDLFVSNAFRMY